MEANLVPSKINGQLTQSEQDKLLKIQNKLLKQKTDIRVRRNISKIFVFDDTWKRKHFRCDRTPDPLLEQYYQTDTFENQRQFGAEIYNAFGDLNTTHVLAIAPTQSGKTGSMLAIAKEFNSKNAHNMVDINNIFIFTGHSSTEWTIQTKQRFPKSMEQNIFHRNHAKRFIKIVADLDNVLILFDESHIANKYGQTLYSIYKQLGLFNIKRLYSKNIKIVHFTATPDSITQHVDIWRKSLKVLHMHVPKNYVSVQSYFDNKQVFDVKPLHGEHQNILDILKHIDIKNPFYHIIRTPRGHKHAELIHDFKIAFEHMEFTFISEPSYNDNIYQLLLHKPNNHTFIFIIDKLRCAKSIHIQHLQICYDRFVMNPKYDSVLQGLIGRCTGYHNHTSHIQLFTFKTLLNSHSFNTQQHNTFNIFAPC